MKRPRRQFLHLAAGAAALPALSGVAWAQAYPTRPVRLLVGFPAGGNADTIARPMGQWLSERLGQPFVIENRPGAGTNIATEAVVRAPADGYTLLMVGPSSAINATLYDNLKFNFIRDIAPVAGIIGTANAIIVNPSVPAKTVPDLIAYAKANPRKVNVASGGSGAPSHIAGELFKMMTGIDMLHVPYRGAAPLLTDLISGQVQVYFGPITASIEHIKAGRLRALAVTTATRSEVLPDVPTVAEFVPGYEASTWYGVGAPKGTSAEIADRRPYIREGVMKLPRRQFLHLAAGAAALPAVSSIARAQAYPMRPVRIVVPYAAGLSPDIIARLVGQALSERLGQQVIIENRPGAGGNIGTEVVVRAPADGYTLLLATGANATNAALYEKLNFDFIRDIAPIAAIGGAALVMVINPSFPAKSVPEFVAYARANPGKLNMASAGSGTTVHLAAELFKLMTGVDFALIQYKGSPWTDVISGQVQGYFGVIPASQEYIKTGKVRALAVTGATRSEVLPQVPTMDEFVPGYEASTWWGVGAPKGTSIQIVEKLNKDINAVVTEPTIKARLVGLGLQPMQLTSAEFTKLIADATNKWGQVIRAANIKPE